MSGSEPIIQTGQAGRDNKLLQRDKAPLAEKRLGGCVTAARGSPRMAERSYTAPWLKYGKIIACVFSG
jgi:hypothetical protein